MLVFEELVVVDVVVQSQSVTEDQLPPEGNNGPMIGFRVRSTP